MDDPRSSLGSRLAVALVLLSVVAGCSALTDTTDSPDIGAFADGGSTVLVTRVVDGDTLTVRYENGITDTVRLVGVDTPEVHVENEPEEFEGVPETAAGRACLRRWGERASAFAQTHLAGETVTLHFDPNLDRRGFYNRLLAYVVVDGEVFNYRLVAEGYARVYDSDFRARERYYEAEASARRRGVGLWHCAEGGPTPTRTTAETATPIPDGGGAVIVVATIHADAAGNDHENLNDEYVVFESRADRPLDLSGWTVTDDVGHTFTFAAGTSLGPGQRLWLHTGSGTASATHRYWGHDGAVWNNGGDTVTLRDADGAVVARRTYG